MTPFWPGARPSRCRQITPGDGGPGPGQGRHAAALAWSLHEVRVLPGTIDSASVLDRAALVEALLRRCREPEPLPPPSGHLGVAGATLHRLAAGAPTTARARRGGPRDRTMGTTRRSPVEIPGGTPWRRS